MATVEGYEVNEQNVITSPGKFEGEKVDILYWYNLMMDGGGTSLDCESCEQDSDEVSCEDCPLATRGDAFQVSREEIERFNLNTNTVEAILYYSESGFVTLDYRIDYSCDCCQAVMVNGTYCHEGGCPNRGKVKQYGEWITPEAEDDDE